ncbi:MAG: MlaD family protein, partial [Saprospiraceae bacterium]|nr:MlaD family protein [Saprospiraceae bacterium]
GFMKLKISNETRVALLAIAAVAFGFWGFQFLKGRNVLTPSQTFYVRYANVDQLRPSSPVFIKGLQIGMVKKLYVDPESYQSIIVQLSIESGVDIPKDAVATIVGLSLMGGKAIEIVVDHPCNGDCADDGDFLQGATRNFLESVIGDPAQIDAYTARIKAGLEINIDSLAKANPGGIAGTVDALDNSLKNLERVTAQVDEILRLGQSGRCHPSTQSCRARQDRAEGIRCTRFHHAFSQHPPHNPQLVHPRYRQSGFTGRATPSRRGCRRQGTYRRGAVQQYREQYQASAPVAAGSEDAP